MLEDTLLLSFQDWIGVPLVENHVHFADTTSKLYTDLDIMSCSGNSRMFVSLDQQELDHGHGPGPALGRLYEGLESQFLHQIPHT